MGSNESRDSVTSIFLNFLIDIIFHLIHFLLVIILTVFNLSQRTLAYYSTKKGLQSELDSANKEGDCVRQRLIYQNEQLERVKEKHDYDISDEHKKYGELIYMINIYFVIIIILVIAHRESWDDRRICK